MRRLARQEVDQVKALSPYRPKNPGQNVFEDAASMLLGKSVAGGNKHQRRPQQRRQPVEKKVFSFEFQAIVAFST